MFDGQGSRFVLCRIAWCSNLHQQLTPQKSNSLTYRTSKWIPEERNSTVETKTLIYFWLLNPYFCWEVFTPSNLKLPQCWGAFAPCARVPGQGFRKTSTTDSGESGWRDLRWTKEKDACNGGNVWNLYETYMGVSKNSGTPKSSILIGFFIINHPFWGTLIFGNTHMHVYNSILHRHHESSKQFSFLRRYFWTPENRTYIFTPQEVMVILDVYFRVCMNDCVLCFLSGFGLSDFAFWFHPWNWPSRFRTSMVFGCLESWNWLSNYGKCLISGRWEVDRFHLKLYRPTSTGQLIWNRPKVTMCLEGS